MLLKLGEVFKGMQERNRDERGFTLIELLVVVIIIGILAAIAIPVFLAQRNRAFEATVQSDLRNAGTAAQTCASLPTNNGSYANCGALTALQANGYNASPNVTLSNFVGTANRFAVDGVNTNGGGTFNFDTNTGRVSAGAHP